MASGISQLFVAGPPVVRFGMGEDLTKEELGGVAVHGASTGVDLWVESEEDALEAARRFLAYLPPSVFEPPPVYACSDPADRREEWLIDAIPRDRGAATMPDSRAVFDQGVGLRDTAATAARPSARSRPSTGIRSA